MNSWTTLQEDPTELGLLEFILKFTWSECYIAKLFTLLVAMIIIALLKELFSAKIIANANSISYPRHLYVLMHALNFEACFSIKILYCTYMICFDAFLKLVHVICLSRGFFPATPWFHHMQMCYHQPYPLLLDHWSWKISH